MERLRVRIGVVSVILFSGLSAARAGQEPLLVVVEASPGAEVGPWDARQAIAGELGTAVVAPRDRAAADTARLLVVAVDGETIRMSLRDGASALVSRTIPAPPERAARLRAIGWLAGNLARDQVSGIVTALPAQLPQAAPTLADAGHPTVATEPPPLPHPTAAPEAAGPAETVTSRALEPAPPQGAQWSITATAGPTMGTQLMRGSGIKYWDQYGSMYELALQRRASPDGLILGAALAIGDPVFEERRPALSGLVGTRWEGRRWYVEAIAGLGIELMLQPAEHTTVSSGTGGQSIQYVTTYDDEPAPFVSGTGLLGVRVSRSFDLVAQISGHFGPMGLTYDYLSGEAGVRLRLP
jgi:hypothetical protein